MRSRSAKTSTTMPPCGCGALVDKAAGFKQMPEDKRISINRSWTLHKKRSKEQPPNHNRFIPKWCVNKLKIIKHIANFTISESHSGTICLKLSVCFGTFAGQPVGQFWTSGWSSKREPKGVKLELKQINITSPLTINPRMSFLLF